MYCNSCIKKIPTDEITYCKECGVPLHKDCANHCLECGADLCDSCYMENRFHCSDCITVNKELKTIRRSYLKMYEDCPYSLYLQAIMGIVPPMGSHAQLGVICHELFGDIQLDKKTIKGSIAELYTRVEEWNKSTNDEYSIIPLSLIDVGENCIQNFGKLLPNLKGEIETETKIEFSLDDKLPKVNCTIDRLSFVGEDIHIHDWKTGKPMSGKQLVHDLQPPIYIYAVYSKYGKLPKTFTLHYLNNEKNITYVHKSDFIYEVKTTRSKYELNVQEEMERVKKLLQDIKKNRWEVNEQKENLWRCDKMCWFGLSGTCEGSFTQEWNIANKEHEKRNAARQS